MHTHFASATFAVAAFLTVAIVGTFWRLIALHTIASGIRRQSQFVVGIGKSMLAQY